MSKIYDENWVMRTVRSYWRQYEASATAFAHRYRSNIFLRTEVRIGILQAIYAAIMLTLAIGALILLYRDILAGVGAAFSTALTSTSTPLSPESISVSLQLVRTREIVGISIMIAFVAIIFGYLISRLALLPARNALEVQKQFIGNIAHELRTPLTIIKTNTEVRLFDSNVPPNARRLHTEILEELSRISDIINNLLTLNSLVQPESLPFSQVDLGAVVQRVVERLQPYSEKKHLTLYARISGTYHVYGNVVALEQIVFNSVKNALQHTTEGSVRVTLTSEVAGYVTITVRDTGSGIARKDLAHLFEPFYRGDSARARDGASGSGLGLAIVSELVKIHQGRITIRSVLGRGTIVMITLPPRFGAKGAGLKVSKAINEVSADFMS